MNMATKELFSTLLDQKREPEVRTTFTLTEEAIEALNWLGEEVGVQARDIAELALSDLAPNKIGADSDSCVRDILQRIETTESGDRTAYNQRKNLVLQRSSVQMLNDLSKSHEIPRDTLVNHLILHARGCIESVVIERNSNRQQVLTQVRDWMGQADSILETLQSSLSESDPCRVAIEETLNDSRDRLESLCHEYNNPTTDAKTDGPAGRAS
ncbi:hypothetical protein KQI63_13675 [bacterium]|nr:hypothetical protein [bacterium]